MALIVWLRSSYLPLFDYNIQLGFHFQVSGPPLSGADHRCYELEFDHGFIRSTIVLFHSTVMCSFISSRMHATSLTSIRVVCCFIIPAVGDWLYIQPGKRLMKPTSGNRKSEVGVVGNLKKIMIKIIDSLK